MNLKIFSLNLLVRNLWGEKEVINSFRVCQVKIHTGFQTNPKFMRWGKDVLMLKFRFELINWGKHFNRKNKKITRNGGYV